MSTVVRLQAANRFDVDDLVALMQVYYEYEELPFFTSHAHAAMFRLLGDETLGSVWFIHAEDDRVGYIAITYGYSLEYGGRYAAIDEFFVQEPYRGRGIGTEVLTVIEEYCRRSDLRALELESLRGNWKAKEFYESLGYKDQGRYTLVKRLDAP